MMKYTMINGFLSIMILFNSQVNANIMDWGIGFLNMTQQFFSSKDECLSVTNIIPAELENIDSSLKFNRNQKCYLACVYKLAGMMQLGRFNPDGFIKMVPEHVWKTDKTGLLAKFRAFSNRCNQKLDTQFSAGNANDECDMAGLIAKCFNQLQGNNPLGRHQKSK